VIVPGFGWDWSERMTRRSALHVHRSIAFATGAAWDLIQWCWSFESGGQADELVCAGLLGLEG